MARIEKINSSSSVEQYAKLPNKIESELMNVINRYFTSNNYLTDRVILTDDEKELLIQEIIQRLYPVLVTISQNSVTDIVEETINNLLGPINNVGSKYIYFKSLIEDDSDKRIIFIPLSSNMVSHGNDIVLNVNGMEQIETEHYGLIYDGLYPDRVIGVDFYDDLLEAGDSVIVKSITKI